MHFLIITNLVWAFSFSLIGVYLSGQVDAWFSVLFRIGLAMLVFIPFLRLGNLARSTIIKVMAIGACQLGVMYGFYYQSFLLLSVPEVLLFTVFTPIYVTLIDDLLHSRFSPWYLGTALIAVLGAVVIKYAGINEGFVIGFLVVQGANIAMAIGQVAYKKLSENELKDVKHRDVFGLFYIGAFLVAAIAFMLLGSTEKMPTTTTQWGVLTYLGIIASGLGYFMWNKGACLVNAGTLAAMNNVLVPLGLLVNLVIWNRDADLVKLALGGSIIVLSLVFNETVVKKRVSQKTLAQ
ncbi:DMT family transporter [Moritella marina ATCC 15381]|uniref:DMT family transporter n=1 Tax=Moritella marina ATCC 15381 TaxID=1202962 RepID=A0A5J6WG26_MORMI|nr:DMT family transporter [Moritella marina]QFI36424.1 DMT family transporter [Moritella marina ATCC 15381]